MSTIIKRSNGNDPNNPNGMNVYLYRGQRIAAYRRADVPMRYKYLNNLPLSKKVK